MKNNTTLNMARYQKMKDSGVEWLGEIPEHWEIKRLSVVGRFSKGGGFSKSDLKKKGTNAVLYGDIYTQYDYCIGTPIRTICPETASNSVKLKKNDLLFTGSGETQEDIGKCVLFSDHKDAVAGGDVIIFRQVENIPMFLSLVLNTHGVSEEKAKSSKGEIIVHTYASKLRELRIPIPPLPEQKAIADFLDRKTGQIDAAVAIKKKQIKLLKERKQILIQHAVTQGLNPDAPKRDSGVEWIGEIPTHWEVKRLKFICEKIQTGTTPTTSNVKYFDGHVNWFNPKDLNDFTLKDSEKKITQLAILRNEVKLFMGDSILIVGIGATTGKTSYLGFEASFNQQITGIHSKKENNLFLCFLIKNLSNVMLNVANYTTLAILNNQFFNTFWLPLPPLHEQTAIVAHIEKESAKIDQVIDLNQQQIAKLKEYKTTLINSAVTGKIKVFTSFPRSCVGTHTQGLNHG